MQQFFPKRILYYVLYPVLTLVLSFGCEMLFEKISRYYLLGLLGGFFVAQFLFAWILLKQKWLINLAVATTLTAILTFMFPVTDYIMSLFVADINPHHEKYYERALFLFLFAIAIFFWEISLKVLRSDKIKNKHLS